MKKLSFNSVDQIGLIVFTVVGFALTSFKYPEYGLIAAFVSQVFWLYSSYRAWREADQIGIFITNIFITLTIMFGIINYWFL